MAFNFCPTSCPILQLQFCFYSGVVVFVGIKAVVYADAFQCFMMVAGQLVVIGVGIAKLDTLADVWDLSWKWDRIQVVYPITLGWGNYPYFRILIPIWICRSK